MRNRENNIESFLHSEITALGGTTRKWVSPGRRGVPDRIVIIYGSVFFVEVKTECGIVSPSQEREATILREHQVSVCFVYGMGGVRKIIADLKENRAVTRKRYRCENFSGV